MTKILLADGSSFLHRGYYAMPNLKTSNGEYTGAVYGLISMLSRVMNREKPDYAVICFDRSRHSFRTDFYPEYKGTRKETPPELKCQFALAHELLKAFGLYSVDMDNFEGDDLIGTLAVKAESLGMQVEIYSGDRDLLQLITDNITVHLTGKSGADSIVFDPVAMQEKYGFKPKCLIDLKALMGDSSDNIPGIAGIGEKTAMKLLQQFDSLENMLQNAAQIENEKLRIRVIEGAEQARLSYRLATICQDVPIEFEQDLFAVKPCEAEKLLTLYRRLEFRSLQRPLEKMIMEKRAQESDGLFLSAVKLTNNDDEFKKQKAFNPMAPAIVESRPFDDEAEMPIGSFVSDSFPAEDVSPPTENNVLSEAYVFKPQFEIIENGNALAAKLALESCIGLFIDYNGAAIYGDITAIGFGFADGKCCYMEFFGELDRFKLQDFKAIFENPQLQKLCYNLKEAKLALWANGIDLQGEKFDAALAAYLLNAAKGDYPPDEVLYPDAALLHNGSRTAAYAACLFPVAELQQKELKRQNMLNLYYEIELPLVTVLFEMEKEGIVVKREELKKISDELGARAEELTAEIYILAACEFNINSPKQLGEVLFEKLGIQGGKKTKTGYSTAAEVLEELAPQYEIIGKVLEYRTCVKLKSTYADGMAKLINPQTGRLHTSFKQTVTATGRLSSAEPNLQNIPVRFEEGRKLRRAFVPSREGNLLLAADYNQIELRVLAHISGDERLIAAFKSNEDIHTRTAMEVFNLPASEITPNLRRQAKAVNFGIVYGISDFGLARDLGISRSQAHDYIERYFALYPQVKEYQEQTIAQAKEQGFVETLYHRRRYLPELHSGNFNIRSFAQRMAINTPIQGSAADIMKIAMLNLHRKLNELALNSKILLQVHDEMILDLFPDEQEILSKLLIETMQQAAILKVPLLADLQMGENWYQLEKVK